MTHSNPTIAITRESNKLSSVFVAMPIWLRIGNDKNTHIRMPLLGINTFCEKKPKIDQAIREALDNFCRASEKFGLGLESDLEFNGWKVTFKDTNSTTLIFESEDNVFEDLMETGDQKALQLEMDQNLEHA